MTVNDENTTQKTNENTIHKTDVSAKKTPMIPIAIALVIALVVAIIGYMYFFPEGIPTN